MSPLEDGTCDVHSFWVEIEQTGPPICGVVHRPATPAVRFQGWLELVSALQPPVVTGDGEIRTDPAG